MKIVAVGGGKGGTGKTAIAVNIAKMFAIKRKILLVDLDVDNPCTYTLLSSKPEIIKEIYAFKP
ncbi:MAG: cobalamin biosynthesis protein CobQ, partial [Thermoprotei archaeon]